MEVRWTDLAVESLNDIIDYVEGCFNPSLAERVGASIVSYVDLLVGSPYLGHPAKEWQAFGNIRRLTFKQNVIYYQLHESGIEVILVWDGRRSPWDMEDLLLDYFAALNREKSE